MVEHPNSLLMHQILQAVTDSDTELLRALWAEDIVWHANSASPWQGDIVGCDAIFDYLAWMGETGTGFDTSVEDILISHDSAALMCHVKVGMGERVLDTTYVLLLRIGQHRVQEIWSLPMEPERIEEFWRP